MSTLSSKRSLGLRKTRNRDRLARSKCFLRVGERQRRRRKGSPWRLKTQSISFGTSVGTVRSPSTISGVYITNATTVTWRMTLNQWSLGRHEPKTHWNSSTKPVQTNSSREIWPVHGVLEINITLVHANFGVSIKTTNLIILYSIFYRDRRCWAPCLLLFPNFLFF